MSIVNKKRIIKNTFFLYLRILILMGVTFYSSRVLLQQLGVDKYGIYNVIGGVVAVFSSLRTIFASAIQRYLNYEKGRGELEKLREIFTVGLIIHFCIGFLFILVAEPLGVWFITHKLVIAPEYINAAYWVFHCSVGASVVLIVTVPFEAVIIANERMSFFAYISILDGVLKLLIVFVLSLSIGNKLELYALLILLVSLIVCIINIVYCRFHFAECKKCSSFSPGIFKNMASFATWNFIGNMAYSLSNEGINVLLNMFGGVIVNAARGIAYQVKSAFSLMLNNIMIAISPQAIQLYAENKSDLFFSIIYLFSRIIAYIYILLALPIYWNTEYILNCWLGQIPEYTILFIRLILVYLFIRTFHGPIDLLFKANGKLKKYQIAELIMLILPLPFSYLAFKFGAPLYFAFGIMIFSDIINLVIILLIAQKETKLPLKCYANQVLFEVSIVTIISYIVSYLISLGESSDSLLKMILQIVTTFIIILIFGFSRTERSKVLDAINRNAISFKR